MDGRPTGEAVPVARRFDRPPVLLSAASRKAVRQRMMMLRQQSLLRAARLADVSVGALKAYRKDLLESGIADRLIQRGAGLAYTRELPQGALLYLLIRSLRPHRVIETGVRPGYSTAWILSALRDNDRGELLSLGPGPTRGRAPGTREAAVGEFVPPDLRARWTLVLGNTIDRLREIVPGPRSVDVFFYDNGPDPIRTHLELKLAWEALTESGVLLAHHVEASPAWAEFCRAQGLPPQIVDPGPPPLGGLSVRSVTRVS